MAKEQGNVDKFNELVSHMARTKEKWEEEDGVEDEQDRLLSEALDMAIAQGSGWSPGEKEAYLEKILDDDFIPPMFATTPEEMEKTGLQEAFTSLIYDEPPTSLMLQFRKQGNEAFANGKRNQVKNGAYYRTAINHYYESLAWAEKIEPVQEGDLAQADTDEPTYNEEELAELKSTIAANIALVHMNLKNWGFMREEAKKAIGYYDKNIKAWYRLAVACQHLQLWEEAGDALDAGLKLSDDSKDLKKLQRQLDEKVRKARKLRQQRERARAERSAKVKEVWKHCRDIKTKLGRVSLVNSISDDDDADDQEESRWHQHLPYSGQLPSRSGSDWSWPCMFLYPSHKQSDFVKDFGENEMIAMRMAQMFPEVDAPEAETAMAWDYNNEFTCSQLAVYFEVHSVDEEVVHPESVEPLRDLASCMKFYESSRALKGDEGEDMAAVVRAVERKHLYRQQKAWKKKHGSLWHKPEPCTVVRVHPAILLRDVLTDPRMVVPNVSTDTCKYVPR